MNAWKRRLLSLYYYGSSPLRCWSAARRQAAGRAPIMVLFYHRIADDTPNNWTTPFDVFERQIRWLKQHFDVVSLAEAQRRIREGNSRPAVSVTFDDGYADNCAGALPLLIEEGIPCTYFVATRFVVEGKPFPHDVARGMPLAPNTAEQLRQMAAAGIELAAHTRTHADIGRLWTSADLLDEIVGGKTELESIVDRPVRYFAFPYGQHGNMSAAAFEMAREAGYEAVVSAYGGYNFPGDDPFHLQRIHGDDDLLRLKNWLTVDPLKLRKTRRFEYRTPERQPQLLEPVAS